MPDSQQAQEHYLRPVHRYNEHVAECDKCDPPQKKFCEEGKALYDDAIGLDKEIR